MIKLYDADSDVLIGTITEQQLQFLEDQMEEESTEDRDYYINTYTIDMFETGGADPNLIALLRQAMADREDMTIKWSRSS